MPTPSSNASDPPSPRFYPLSSCPDPEEQQPTSQTASEVAPTSPESPSHSVWRRPLSPSSHPADRGAGPNPTVTDDSRSATMSPGPQSEGTVADMGHEPDRMVVSHDVAGERHKPADADDDMSAASDEHARGGAGGGSCGGSRDGIARTTLGGATGRRKPATERLSSVMGKLREVDVWNPAERGPRWVEDSGLVGLGLEYSHMRVMTPAPSLYLQPGSKFAGTQQSERQRYDVEVEIKHVDMRESFLCGYLKIQGLTDDHPTLTTYFEGEIIGTKYGFITQHQGWGASEKIDLSHWSKFTAFRPYLKQARKGGHTVIKDVDQRENIFMRWKEHFLVPDHRVRTINGASFEGFYYICFNQVKGEVSGIYFHSKSEKFQQLELKYVDNKGCFGAMEFR
ncbi:hypothetical protein N657DRAFT_654504 [Parathielavia appendiculata]|uniref:Vacuolar import and degradation protein n=1 Tax=Parathielavia appendiculata TaxID=2587402 RepID=A0AAN6U411_9PEZI|nr:hypothetical protein N657DRAFT_654504 [Parathielavia appendiculata]